ncbi:MAG: imidazole glycerol phosphate synthase subunit HisH [Bacteroidetes bacterium]|nr:imidazole glycerol phosphate synthase subunit HisH [Bacteroidota bacterium]
MNEEKKYQVAIIDYEMGNMFSVDHACKYVGLNSIITEDKDVIMNSDAAILPGVGAFGNCMANLNKLDLVSPIKDFVASGKPFLGICLGLQLLFTESEEFGLSRGLDLIQGKVVRFPSENTVGKKLKVPQVGWNHIYENKQNENHWGNSILKDTTSKEFMYFVHSYYVKPDNDNDILTLTNYEGIEYCSGVKKNNITAFQFHPEKSGHEGIKIYKNWVTEIKNFKEN